MAEVPVVAAAEWGVPEEGKKRVAIVTSGSRGDTQPYIALGLACKAAGHAVRIAVEERLRPLVESFGLEFFKIAGDPTAILWSKESQEMLRDGKVLALMSKMDEYIKPYFKQALADYEKACEGADVIVSGPLSLYQTYCVAEKLRVPLVAVLLGPTLKTSDFPLFFLMETNLGIGFINRATYNLMFYMMWRHDKDEYNSWRTRHLKLPPIDYSTGIVGMLSSRIYFVSILTLLFHPRFL
jgi:sterol 3beta-glucosyltransferase